MMCAMTKTAAFAASFLLLIVFPGAAQEAVVITLTQTGCQFTEPEGTDRGYTTHRPEDCKTINRESRDQRLATHQVLRLTPGRYVFRVSNVNVPYELGFYLRASNRALIPFAPRVSGGGLGQGETQDYAVDLSPGDYLYSCPYNPTPNYRLVVSE